MAVRPIVIWPDSRLRQETRAIERVDDDVRSLYRDLCDTMFALNGLGIAAIQIGDPRRMFLIEATLAGGTREDPPLAFINPEIVWLGDEGELADEGCLSFPSVYVPIERALAARVRATNLDGETFEVEATDLYARALQHENDHLTGRLLVDFVGPLKRQMIKRKLKKQAESDNESAGAARG